MMMLMKIIFMLFIRVSVRTTLDFVTYLYAVRQLHQVKYLSI